MTTAPAPSAPAPILRWNTPNILKTSRAVLLALDGLLVIAVLLGAQVHRHAMKLVGEDTAPSIIAAQHIKAALADMDADLANALLMPSAKANTELGAYDKRRNEASVALIEAAKNITYGDAEEKPIESLQLTAGDYERLAQQARDLEDEGQTAKSTQAYRSAGIKMDATILPAADDLDKANNDVLEREYDQQSSRSVFVSFLAALLGLLTFGALVAAQVFLSRRTNRTLNPALLAATILTGVLTLYAFVGMSGEEHDLKVARQDAFTSIHALWQARAVAYSANGTESRYLLDPLHRDEYEAEFFARANTLARIPASLSRSRVVAAAQAGSGSTGFTGYLADELNNITFAGEREAAVRTLAAFERYMEIDAEIRRLERAGQHEDAIKLCIGASPGQSDWAFEQFDQALGATLKINKDAFDAAVSSGFSALSGMEYKAAVAAVLIAILIVVGFAPRIREYE